MSNNTVESSKVLSHWMSAAGFFLWAKWLRHAAEKKNTHAHARTHTTPSMSHINYHHLTSDFTTLQAIVGSPYWHTATKQQYKCHCRTISWKMASLPETVECHRTQHDSICVCGGSTMSKILLCGSHIIQQGWPTSTHWRATQLVRTHLRIGLVCTRIKRWGNELTWMPLFTNVTVVLLLLIKVAILCSVDLLYYVCKKCIIETTRVTESCKYFPWGMHAAHRLHVGQQCNTVSQKHSSDM